MDRLTIFLQDSNIDLNKEFMEKYLVKVSDDIKKNPSFTRQLYAALAFLTRKARMEDRVPPMELSIAEDGRSFEIRSGIRPDPDCLNDDLKSNKCFETVKFTLDGKNNMNVTMMSGTLYRYDDFMKVSQGTPKEQEFKIFNSHDTPTVLSVFHRNIVVLDSGIEVSRASYADQYPLGITMDNENELKIQTSIHSPQKWNFNFVPDGARFELNPIKTNDYRFINSLGIFTSLLSTGRNGKVEAKEYLANTEYPEVLSASTPLPFREYQDGVRKMNPRFAEYYPGKDEKEIEKEVEQSFANGLDTSKTKEFNPQVYEILKKYVDGAFEQKYGIKKAEEVEKGPTL